MSHDEIQDLKGWMLRIETDLKEWMVRIEADGKKTQELVHEMRAMGCAKAASHEATVDDLGARLRVVEVWITEWKGRMIGIGVAIGVAAWAAERALSLLK